LNDVYAPIRTHSPDIILLGYDQEIFVDGLEKLVFEDGLDIKIRRLKAYKPEECKSSILRKNMEK
jgi:glycerol-3-phosphate cytidylyltransferase-like family protein